MFDRITAITGIFIAFMLVSNSTTLLPFDWGIAYYVLLVVATLYLFTRGVRKVNGIMIGLYLVAMLSIIFNDVPSFFKPWPRLGTFVLLSALVSPAFCGKKLMAFRVQMFSFVCLFLTLVTLISTAYLLSGRGYGFTHMYFQGATVHSMIMGPVAVISNLYCVYQLQYRHRKWWMKYFYIAGIVGGSLCILQSGSRAALIGAMFSILVFFVFRYASHTGKLFKYLVVIAAFLFVAIPIWRPYTDKIQQKNAGSMTGLNIDSRQIHWQQRIHEWRSSPVIGIGFGTVDTEAEGSTFDERTGSVETGNSWLCVLSMTGVLGFICVLSIFCGAAYRAWRLLRSSPPVGALLLAMMVFFMLHMMAEGYIYAGGNFLNTQLWLLLGMIYGLSQYPLYARILEQKLQLHF